MYEFMWAGIKFGSSHSDCGPEDAPYPYLVVLTEGSKGFQKNMLVTYAEQAGLVICEMKRDAMDRPRAMMRQPIGNESPGKAFYME